MRKFFDESRALSTSETEEKFPPLPCSRCQRLTPRETLTQHGTRCIGCYEAYLREPSIMPAWMADKRSDGLRAWADALSLQEAVGARLTPAQKAMWRAAKHRLSESSEVAE